MDIKRRIKTIEREIEGQEMNLAWIDETEDENGFTATAKSGDVIEWTITRGTKAELDAAIDEKCKAEGSQLIRLKWLDHSPAAG